MNQKRKEYWEKAQSKGKLKFILVNGILFHGLPLGVLFFLYRPIYNYFFDYSNFQSSNNRSLPDLIITLIVWSIAGSINGLLTWNKMEKEFSQNNLENK